MCVVFPILGSDFFVANGQCFLSSSHRFSLCFVHLHPCLNYSTEKINTCGYVSLLRSSAFEISGCSEEIFGKDVDMLSWDYGTLIAYKRYEQLSCGACVLECLFCWYEDYAVTHLNPLLSFLSIFPCLLSFLFIQL